MTTIAQYRVKVLAVLDDASSTKFSANQVDQALRDALQEYSAARPVERTYVFDATGEDRITLPADFVAMQINRVELEETNPNEGDKIDFFPINVDEQWVFETPGRTVPLGKVFVIYYTSPHFVDGLDSAAGTTVPDADDEILSLGAAGYACQSRAVARSEANNLDEDTIAELEKLGNRYLSNFRSQLGGKDKGLQYATWELDTDGKF